MQIQESEHLSATAQTILQKFLFEGMPVRGAAVRVTDGWQQLLQRRTLHQGQAYPPAVRRVLGEMVAAAALMQSNIKFDGALVLQIMGDGPVSLAVAEMHSDCRFRAAATVQAAVADDAPFSHMVNVLGQGRCAITLDPEKKRPGQQPYQGIVPLCDAAGQKLEGLGDAIGHYMRQSEQLDTVMVLAADDRVAAGVYLQRMPLSGEGNLAATGSTDNGTDSDADADAKADEDYTRLAAFVNSVKRRELLELSTDELLHRLFWEEPVMRFEPLRGDAAPRFSCSCSRQKVAGMIQTLGQQEAQSILDEKGVIDVDCQYCGAKYCFDTLTGLFPPDASQPPASASIH